MRGFKRVWDEERKVWKYNPVEQVIEKQDMPKIEFPEIPWTLLFSIFAGGVFILLAVTFGPKILEGLNSVVVQEPGTGLFDFILKNPVSFLIAVGPAVVIFNMLFSDRRRNTTNWVLFIILLIFAYAIISSGMLSQTASVTP